MKKKVLLKSKWEKHKLAMQSPSLQAHLPRTALYSPQNLRNFLKTYPVVFIKPVDGQGGKRVFRVTRLGNRRYFVNMQRTKRMVHSMKKIDEWVKGVGGRTRFIIQQGVQLKRWRGRPVDIRTIVQKNERKQWEVTGMFVKMAGKNLAVTNVCIGGKAYPLPPYLRGVGYNKRQQAALIQKLQKLSLAIANHFGKHFSHPIYGLDIGLDNKGKLWLIEVNTVPSLKIFKKLKLYHMYERSANLAVRNHFWRSRKTGV